MIFYVKKLKLKNISRYIHKTRMLSTIDEKVKNTDNRNNNGYQQSFQNKYYTPKIYGNYSTQSTAERIGSLYLDQLGRDLGYKQLGGR